MPDVNPPPEVVKSSDKWRTLIARAFESGHRIELQTDNIVELLGFNFAMNRCIEAGVFDEDIKKQKKGKQTVQTMILEELGDLKIRDRERFLAKRYEEYPGHNRLLWQGALAQLITNGLVYEKMGKIGRGACIALWEIGQSIDLRDLFGKVKDFVATGDDTFSIDENGKLARNPPFKLREDQKKSDKFNRLIEFGLIVLKKESARFSRHHYYIDYELTPLGRYCREIFGKCEIAQD